MQAPWTNAKAVKETVWEDDKNNLKKKKAREWTKDKVKDEADYSALAFALSL